MLGGGGWASQLWRHTPSPGRYDNYDNYYNTHYDQGVLLQL